MQETVNIKTNWGIYKILNTKNNKFYIGSSTNLSKRLYEHRRELNLGIHINKHLQNAWDKYGEEAFTFSIVEELVEDKLDNKYLRDLETFYIQKYKCYLDTIGYNNIPGGIGTYGLPCSEDKKQKISEANKGKNAWNKGIPMSEEQKLLLRQINSEKRGKSIDIYTLEGEYIETIESIRELSRLYKVGRNTIKDCCDNLIKNPTKYIFRYHGDPLETLGNNAKIEDPKIKQERIRKVAISKGKAIDVYDFDGNFIETCLTLADTAKKYETSETSIKRFVSGEQHHKQYVFVYHGLEFKIPMVEYFVVYDKNSMIPVEYCRHKQDINKYALYREKSKLKNLLTNCNSDNPEFEYDKYIIKLELAPCNSDITSESRQLNKGGVEGINNDANGKA